jgi:glucose/arabinose dehydrogenase
MQQEASMRIWLALTLAIAAAPLSAQTVQTSAGAMAITPVATGLDEPWGLAFLPDGRFLVTERGGRLWLFTADGATRTDVTGLPDIAVGGQGGLLDVMVPADFATSRRVWLSFSEPQGRGAGTAAAIATLSADGTQLTGLRTVFSAPEGGRGGRHFGSRLAEAPDGTVFLTIGDRGTGPDGMAAQDPQRAEGKVIHLTADGAPATDLPGALPGVHSLGHRNPQGAAFDGQGRLWIVDHGAEGGDELNRIRPGANYGWPVITYGRDYGGAPIGTGTAQDGMEEPARYWDPSIAPSGLMFLQDGAIPAWEGDAFFGSLNSDYLGRLDADGGWAEERIATPETLRVRDVAQGPDGAVWFLSVGNGALYRMAPGG